MDTATAAPNAEIAAASQGQITIRFTSPKLARGVLVRVLSHHQARKTVAAYLATPDWTGAEVFDADGFRYTQADLWVYDRRPYRPTV